MKTSTPISSFIRRGVATSALGMAISLSSAANAQVVDAPPHRVEFTVSPGLPKCSDYDAFYGILVNWVRIRTIDPTAKRKLIVDIKRRPDGGKQVKLSVFDAEGVEVGVESHGYPSTEECFKVLYWTAFDASKLLRSTIPPPVVVEEPPMSVDKLVKESEKPDRVQEKPTKRSDNGPIYDPEFYADPKASRQPCEAREEPRLPGHVILGVGATIGLTRMAMPGVRLGVGRTVGPLMFELDARVFPPVMTAEWETGPGQQVSGRAHGYLGSFAACAQRKPLIGCVVATGGVAGYVYDKPALDGERFAKEPIGGLFYMGLRTGLEFPVSARFALRLDVDAQLPIYRAQALQHETPGQNIAMTMLTGFISVVPAY